MRIYLKLSPNTEPVPFNYQQSLVGAFHKWLGENELHDEISLYSLSWLEGGKMRKDQQGLDFRNGANFCISSPLEALHQKAVKGIFKDQYISWGMKVREVTMKPVPEFGSEQRFLLKSPVLIKRDRPEEKHQQYYFYHNLQSDQFMTETLQKKLLRFDFPTDVKVAFDRNFPRPHTKKITFNNIDIKASICPVIVKGDPAAVKFAWNVGVGNSTGIGFGALK
ncbi:MAG: CRISPR-associated endoribonuclease Cas6 [Bacteroidota bacterium]